MAVIVGMILAIVGAALTGFEVLPTFEKTDAREEQGYLGQLLVVPVFLLTMCFGHELQWLTSRTTSMTFIDKACIHQTDGAMKQQGIVKLGAFLARSNRMVICYTDVYLRKLWTVYEIACFLVMHPLEQLTIIHTNWAMTYFIGVVFLYLTNMRSWVPVLRESFVYLLTTTIAAMVNGFYMRHVLRGLHTAQERVLTFNVLDAACFCEDDRPLVQENIYLLLRHAGYCDASHTRAETMELFNKLVREHLPQALSASMGTSGVPYHFTFFMALPLAFALFFDNPAVRMKNYGFFSRNMLLFNLADAVDTLVIIPSVLQTWAKLMSKCMKLRGWREKAYVVCTIFVSTTFLGFAAFILPYDILMPLAKKSDLFTGVFILYVFLWIAYSVFIFGGSWSQLIKAFRRTARKATGGIGRTDSQDWTNTETMDSFKMSVDDAEVTVDLNHSEVDSPSNEDQRETEVSAEVMQIANECEQSMHKPSEKVPKLQTTSLQDHLVARTPRGQDQEARLFNPKKVMKAGMKGSSQQRASENAASLVGPWCCGQPCCDKQGAIPPEMLFVARDT